MFQNYKLVDFYVQFDDTKVTDAKMGFPTGIAEKMVSYA